MKQATQLVTLVVALAWLTPTVSADVDFNRDIRPILSENCFYCHGQDANHRKADLRLDVRDDAIKGKAFVPGDAAKSSLVDRIFTDDAEELMPPPKSNRKLSAKQKDLLKRLDRGGGSL